MQGLAFNLNQRHKTNNDSTLAELFYSFNPIINPIFRGVGGGRAVRPLLKTSKYVSEIPHEGEG